MGNPFVTPRLFAFLRDLAAHNEREWFNASKARYHADVRDPLFGLIETLGPGLSKISASLLADPSPVGGSLFRIHRDTRFARDKSPYKTHAGIHFRHAAGRDVHAPGIYLHLEPRRVFVAAGMWRPDTDALRRLRVKIAGDPAAWRKTIRRLPLDEGERLVRPPRGFDPDHPLVEDLKRKSFTATVALTQRAACADDFPDQVIRASRRAGPLMAFLAGAMQLDW